VDGLYIADNILKFVRERTEILVGQITEGSVPDFTAYQKLRAHYEAFVAVENEIRSLLKRMGMEDE